MEHNGTLPKCWNGSAEQEHLNTQHWAWTHAKKKDCDNKIAHYDEFTTELQTLWTQQTESLNLDKSLQAQIKALQNNCDINQKGRLKALQQQVKDEKKKQWELKNQQQVIDIAIQELKDNGLSGSRINGCCPAVSVENKAVEWCTQYVVAWQVLGSLTWLKYDCTGSNNSNLLSEPVIPPSDLPVSADNSNLLLEPVVLPSDLLSGDTLFHLASLTPLTSTPTFPLTPSLTSLHTADSLDKLSQYNSDTSTLPTHSDFITWWLTPLSFHLSYFIFLPL